MVIIEEINQNRVKEILKRHNTSISGLIISDGYYLVCRRNNSFALDWILYRIRQELVNKIPFRDIKKLSCRLSMNEKELILEIIRNYKDRFKDLENELKIIRSSDDLKYLSKKYSKRFDKIILGWFDYFIVSYFIYNRLDIDRLRDRCIINKYNKPIYIMPGGKMKEGEDVKDCLIREIYEETGIYLRECRYTLGSIYYVEMNDRVINKTFTNIVFTINLVVEDLGLATSKFKPNVEISALYWWKYYDDLTSLNDVFFNL